MSDNILDTLAPKVDQLTADDLIGQTKTIIITRVAVNSTAEQPVSIFFENDGGKPFRPSKGMRRVMVQVWGADTKLYTGRSMTLYRDDGVKFGGLEVGGIRVSHMSHIERAVTMALTEKKGSKKPFVVKPLAAVKPPAAAAAAVPQDSPWRLMNTSGKPVLAKHEAQWVQWGSAFIAALESAQAVVGWRNDMQIHFEALEAIAPAAVERIQGLAQDRLDLLADSEMAPADDGETA